MAFESVIDCQQRRRISSVTSDRTDLGQPPIGRDVESRRDGAVGSTADREHSAQKSPVGRWWPEQERGQGTINAGSVDFCRRQTHLQSMEVDLVLAPVDASHRAEQSVTYAATIAERYDASLHLLYVLDETLVCGLCNSAIEEVDQDCPVLAMSDASAHLSAVRCSRCSSRALSRDLKVHYRLSVERGLTATPIR